jgi:hypothetical protein
MTDSTPPLAPELLSALELVLDRLAPLAVPWAVTGSLGMRLQGVPLAVHDLDLQSDGQGFEAMADLLCDYIAEPPAYRESPDLRSMFGILRVGAARVELMGDLQKRAADGTWEPPTRVADHLQKVEWRGRVVPVLDLSYEEQAYRRLGRTDRADLLRRWLAGQGI